MEQEEVVEPEEVTMVTACRDVLSIALKNGGVLKGIAETLKALELGNKVKMVFLAEDCDNDDYKNTVIALAKLQGVPLVEIPTWVELKDFCNLGLASKVITQIAEEKGKEAKIKPRCSVASIIDWGEDSEARQFIFRELKIEQ